MQDCRKNCTALFLNDLHSYLNNILLFNDHATSQIVRNIESRVRDRTSRVLCRVLSLSILFNPCFLSNGEL